MHTYGKRLTQARFDYLASLPSRRGPARVKSLQYAQAVLVQGQRMVDVAAAHQVTPAAVRAGVVAILKLDSTEGRAMRPRKPRSVKT